MKFKYIISAAIACMVSLSSCVKDDIASLEGVVAEPSYISLGFEGGTATTIIKTNEAWSLEIDDDTKDWLTVTPTSGEAAPNGAEIKFTMTATQAPRKTEVMLVVGKKTQILTVGQNGYVEPVIMTAKDFNDDNVCPQGPSYYVEGVITKVEKYDYGNLYLRDDAGDEVYVYGVLDADGNSKNFTSLGIDVGDKVVLYGSKGAYNGKPQMVNATLIEVTVPAIFDLDFRAIRTMYTEANPDTDYSTYTKDDWKNLFKADALELVKDGLTLTVPVTFKGDKLGFVAQKADWVSLSGMTQEGSTYYMSFVIAPYLEKAAPRETTIVIEGMVEMEKDGKKEEKVSNFELPIMQYGEMPELATIAEAMDLDYVKIKGTVAAKHTSGYVLVDDSDAILVYKPADFDLKKCNIGDEMEVLGWRKAYNFGPQMDNPWYANRTEKGDGSYTYPTPVTVDAAKLNDIISATKADGLDGKKDVKVKVQYITATGKLSSAGKYKNMTIAGDETNQVSLYNTIEDFKIEDYDGKDVVVKGYTTSVSSGKYLNIVLTSVEEAK